MMSEKEQYTDSQVIEKILHGDWALFEIIVRRNNPVLYKTGRTYGFSHEDTQDLMQDSFIDAFKALSKFEQRSSLKTWIVKIMLNNCYHKKQKASYKNEVIAEIRDDASPLFSNRRNETNNKVMNRELTNVIEQALLNIPGDYRMVFSLREMNGLSVAETADALQISEANVKTRLNRAKAMLRTEVQKSYSSEEIFGFNLVYCDPMVNKVMTKIKALVNE